MSNEIKCEMNEMMKGMECSFHNLGNELMELNRGQNEMTILFVLIQLNTEMHPNGIKSITFLSLIRKPNAT